MLDMLGQAGQPGFAVAAGDAPGFVDEDLEHGSALLVFLLHKLLYRPDKFGQLAVEAEVFSLGFKALFVPPLGIGAEVFQGGNVVCLELIQLVADTPTATGLVFVTFHAGRENSSAVITVEAFPLVGPERIFHFLQVGFGGHLGLEHPQGNQAHNHGHQDCPP
jgi:hypothetical protein